MPITAPTAIARCSNRSADYRLCCCMNTLGPQTRIWLLCFQKYGADAHERKGIPGKETLSQHCRLLIKCHFILLPKHFVGDTEVGTSSFFCATVAQAPNEIRAHVAVGKIYMLRNTAWPQAHTVRANEGKVEGKAEIQKNEVTRLRLRRRSVAEAEPKELSKCYSCWQGP